MRNEFLWWCIACALAVAAFLALIVADANTMVSHKTMLVYLPAITLFIATLILLVGAYSRRPGRPTLGSRVIELYPFCSIVPQSKYNGDGLTLRLRMMLERELRTSDLRAYAPEAATLTFNLKIGDSGIAIPISAVTRWWGRIRARQVTVVRPLVDETSEPPFLLISLPVADDSPRAVGPMMSRETISAAIESAPRGLERALLALTRELLRVIDPIALANRYAAESNFGLAITTYLNETLHWRHVAPDIEIMIAELEIQWYRWDKALELLQKLEHAQRSATPIDRLKSVMADAYCSGGNYEMAKEAALASQDRTSNGEIAVRSMSILATISELEEDYTAALDQWEKVRVIASKEYCRRFGMPEDRDLTFPELLDETFLHGADVNLAAQLVDAILRIMILRQWVGKYDADDAALEDFSYSSWTVEHLNLVDSVRGRVYHYAARIRLAYCSYLRAKGNSEGEVQLLKEALQFEQISSDAYETAVAENPADVGAFIGSSWSSIGRLNVLRRLAGLTAADERANMEREVEGALTAAKSAIGKISGTTDKVLQAEADYAEACLAAIQGKADEAIEYLGRAMATTSVGPFSSLANRAKLDSDFDGIRTNSDFRTLVGLRRAALMESPQ